MMMMRLLKACVLFAFVAVAGGQVGPGLRAEQAAPAAAANAADVALDRPLPIDPAVRSGTLANGLRFFIRQNGRPAERVSLRLAVDAGSIEEEPDQRGLAHFLEHMAFNGTENFKPGELVAFLESIGARFGPHVNASTSFDETIYMLDVPTDRDGYVDKGLLALRDFAAGIELMPAEVEKERGVVLEEWRGRLGASSRLTDQQLPVLLQGSRYAERLPIGTPEVIKGAPRDRLLAFYKKWYRPDRMAVIVVGDIDPAAAEKLVRARFDGIAKPSEPPGMVDHTIPPHKETLYSLATDPEAQGWTVTVSFKSAAPQQKTVGDYRAALVRQLVGEMLNPRLREIARRPNAPFIGAEASADTFGRSLQLFEIGAAVPENGLATGLEAVMLEARRAATVRLFRRRTGPRAARPAGFLRARLQRARHDGEPELRRRVRPPLPGGRADSRYRARVPHRSHASADGYCRGGFEGRARLHLGREPGRSRGGAREDRGHAPGRQPPRGHDPCERGHGGAVEGSDGGPCARREPARAAAR